MKLRKKLIEVALPLDAINKASAREKSIRHGHPSTLHLWWARRPLAAARAVIFSQMVDDPSEYVDVLKMDAKLKRRAEAELKKRLKVWEELSAAKEKADSANIESPDPGREPNLDDIIAEQERDRLFKIIEDLVLWENTTNEEVLNKAREEIRQSWRRACADNADHPRAAELFDRNKLPAFHDPFAGGGALPLEAQRLGLEAYASDLNPVAVLINKAMIEIPPKFAGMPPVNPESGVLSSESGAGNSGSRLQTSDSRLFAREWRGAEGLAEDVRYYGKWMRDEAEKRIGHLYPKVKAVQEKDGSWRHATDDDQPSTIHDLTVIAWIWARTVKSPNPAFRDVDVPLASTFMLSTKAGKEAYVEPIIEDGGYRFEVRTGKPKDPEAAKVGTKLARGANFGCIMSDAILNDKYIKAESMAGRMGSKLMAIVAEGKKGRVYLSPTAEQEEVARKAVPAWKPDQPMNRDTRDLVSGRGYGFFTWADLFTSRQLVALTMFSNLVGEAIEKIEKDAGLNADRGMRNAEGSPAPDSKLLTQDLKDGGTGAKAYAQAVGVYLAFAIDRMAMTGNNLVRWNPVGQKAQHCFGRQALPMLWDFAEPNFFATATGSAEAAVFYASDPLSWMRPIAGGLTQQADAATQSISKKKVISTDPPYYDNIGYADLSDFFYVWLRSALRNVFSDIFSTVTVPKKEELVATQYRHGTKEIAEKFFLNGMTNAMARLSIQGHQNYPVTIYYAFKQSETEETSGTSSTGWETFLEAVIQSGFGLSGTWPMRTEMKTRQIAMGTNALASSIVLVCRKRDEDARTVTRREFVDALKKELPEALRHLQRGNIAPVDLAQAAIGPGMAVFTRYEKVIDAEGEKLTVRQALALINQTLDETLAEQEGDFDADTRWALTWFDQYGFDTGEFGVAEQLSKSKNTSIADMADVKTSPIIEAKAGKVRLFKPAELEEDWSPETDGRLTVWDMVHQLIRVLEKDGEVAASRIVGKLGAKAETARELCYRLYTVCERKKRAADALSYNALVQSWPEIIRLAQQQAASTGGVQSEMFEQ